MPKKSKNQIFRSYPLLEIITLWDEFLNNFKPAAFLYPYELWWAFTIFCLPFEDLYRGCSINTTSFSPAKMEFIQKKYSNNLTLRQIWELLSKSKNWDSRFNFIFRVIAAPNVGKRRRAPELAKNCKFENPLNELESSIDSI